MEDPLELIFHQLLENRKFILVKLAYMATSGGHFSRPLCTLDSGINIGVRLLIFEFFSRGYVPDPTSILDSSVLEFPLYF